jgi:hypothetical protein
MPWSYSHDRALPRAAVEDVGERHGCVLVVNMLDRGHDRRLTGLRPSPTSHALVTSGVEAPVGQDDP